jgi:hypothetical protein
MGAAAAFKVVPSTGVAIVALTNGYPIGVPEIIAAQFFDLVEFGAIQRDYPALVGPFFAVLNAPEGSLVGLSPPCRRLRRRARSPITPAPIATTITVRSPSRWRAARFA